MSLAHAAPSTWSPTRGTAGSMSPRLAGNGSFYVRCAHGCTHTHTHTRGDKNARTITGPVGRWERSGEATGQSGAWRRTEAGLHALRARDSTHREEGHKVCEQQPASSQQPSSRHYSGVRPTRGGLRTPRPLPLSSPSLGERALLLGAYARVGGRPSRSGAAQRSVFVGPSLRYCTSLLASPFEFSKYALHFET